MGPIGCPETSVRNYHYSLRNNPEERSPGYLAAEARNHATTDSVLYLTNNGQQCHLSPV